MLKVILVASGKGGTGKTSLTAGVGAALAANGHRVLVIDGDCGLRNLDIVLGMSDRVVYSFADVAGGMVQLADAMARHPVYETLYLLTAPVRIRRDPVTASQMGTLLRQVRQKFDFCLLDAPAGLGRGFRLATCAADRCVVVTTSDASSLRDAQHTVMELGRFPNGTLHLVVNRVRKKLLRSMHATIDDAIDRAGLPLLGVVPEDDSLPLSLNQGMPPLPPQASAAAYRNIAHRLQGQRVPLLRIK